MIFPPIELPQYIVVPPTDCEMKDIIGYHNKHLTGKISFQVAFFKKSEFLISAINLSIWHHLNFCDIHLKSNIFSELWFWQAIVRRAPVNFGANFEHIINFAGIQRISIYHHFYNPDQREHLNRKLRFQLLVHKMFDLRT